MKTIIRAAVAAVAATALLMPAQAAEKLRVGKAVAEAFSFTPVEIGIRPLALNLWVPGDWHHKDEVE